MSRAAGFLEHPASAGRSLGVLVLAWAILWLWFQIPGWYAPGPDDAVVLRMQAYWLQPGLLLLLLMVLNVLVLFGSTLPLALPGAPGTLLDAPQWPRHLVFWASVVFHLGSCAALVGLTASWLQL
jgi:hypothetical protein